MYRFFIVFLINCNLIAIINGKTDFAKLPKSLSDIYYQLMVTRVIENNMSKNWTCTSIAISTNQILTSEHCFNMFKLSPIDNTVYQFVYYIMIVQPNFYFHYDGFYPEHNLIPNQDFTLSYAIDSESKTEILFKDIVIDLALITINSSAKIPKFSSYLPKTQIVKTKDEYCSYFDSSCKYLKPGVELYVFGIRNDRLKSYLPKRSPKDGFSYVPEWSEIIVDSNNNKSFYNRVSASNNILLMSHENYMKTEQGDSGGPIFICKKEVKDKDNVQSVENVCKLISIHAGYNGLWRRSEPVFKLKSLEEKDLKPAIPIYKINTCDSFYESYKENRYLYFLNKGYYQLNTHTTTLKIFIYDTFKTVDLKFFACENNGLYFTNFNNQQVKYFKLSSLNFYNKNATVDSTAIIKLDDCDSFYKYAQLKEDNLIFYTYDYKLVKNLKLQQKFYKITKEDEGLSFLFFNLKTLEWELINKLDLIKCFQNKKNNLFFLEFIDANKEKIYFPLYQIIFYK